MDFLRKLWPTPFKIEKRNTQGFVVQLIIFIVVCAIIGILLGVLASVPVVGVIFGIVASLVELYCTVGIVLCILKFVGVID